MDRTAIFLSSQAKRIGTGLRVVEVITAGYKWVTVRYWPGGPGAEPIRHKFRKTIWNNLRKTEIDK